MFLGRNKHGKRLETCGLVWTGEKEPFTLISKLLKSGGVRLGKVDKEQGRIVARMPILKGSGSCKVTLHLFPQIDVCLVVATWEPPRWGDAGVLTECVERLSTYLDNVKLVDEEGMLDWKRRGFRAIARSGLDSGTATVAQEIGTGHA